MSNAAQSLRSKFSLQRSLAFTIVMLGSLACNAPILSSSENDAVDAQAAGAPAQRPTVDVSTLPPTTPQITTRRPFAGDELPLDEVVTIYFDQPMDQQSVADALVFEGENGAIPYVIEWVDPATVMVRADAGQLQHASDYVLRVEEGAMSSSGLPLAEPVELPVRTLGFLNVTEFSPIGDATDTDVPITLLFNRPIIALGEERDLQLEISPTVSGSGEWVNTSIYQFVPDVPLAGGQTYNVTLPEGLVALDGAALQESISWEFTTLPPDIIALTPEPESKNFPLDGTLQIDFNQPMDAASVEANTSIIRANGETVSGSFEWDDAKRSVTFVPASNLPYGQTFTAEISNDALGESGTPLFRPIIWEFTTVERPAVLSTFPANGETEQQPFGRLEITFNAPLDPESIDGSLIVSEPELPDRDFIFYNSFSSALVIDMLLEPKTTYTVTLLPGAVDPYGTEISEPFTFSFTTGGLDPQITLGTHTRYGLYDASTETELFLVHRNIDTIDFTLTRIEPLTFIEATGTYNAQEALALAANDSPPLRQWRVETPNEPDEPFLLNVSLVAEEGGLLEPGIYLLTVDALEDTAAPTLHYMTVTNANLTYKLGFDEAFVWLTDLRSGEPLPNEEVVFYDQLGTVIGSGTTGPDGTLIVPIITRENLSESTYAVATIGSEVVVAQSFWSQGFKPFNFSIPTDYVLQPFSTYLYTDRPIYQPGQDVFFKGILRELGEEDSLYRLPAATEIVYEVRNSRSEVILQATAVVNEYGTFNGNFTLADDGRTGSYNIIARIGEQSATVSFEVEEYRPPEFFIELEASNLEVLTGEALSVTANAEFFFGGAVSEAPLRYKVISRPYIFDRYEGNGFYSFSSLDRINAWNRLARVPSLGELVDQGEGVTDEAGQFIIDVPTDLIDEDISRHFTIEVSVEELNGRIIFERINIIVHQGQYYVGVQPETYVGEVEVPQDINLIVVDWDGNPISDAGIDVAFFDRTWRRVIQENPVGSASPNFVVEENQIGATFSTTSGSDGRAVASVTPPEGGTFKVRAIVSDSDGGQNGAETLLWASSRSVISWQNDDSNRLEIIPDQDVYQPGDTAELLIASPFTGEGVQALITIERNGILDYEIVDVPNSALLYEVPITSLYAPNVFVSVLLYAPVNNDNRVPDFRVGYAELTVDPSEQALNVTLTPDRDQVGPGDTVTFTIETTDFAGSPVPAEVSLALIDRAVLDLAAPNSEPILEFFYDRIGLSVATAVPLSVLVEALDPDLLRGVDGGRGGGGGDGLFSLREDFQDTAFWSAVVRTGPEGTAQVEIELPDNLTIWRLDARAVTPDTQVGQAEVDIVTSKPLLIRPQTPRFFVAGDEVTLGAIINNNIDQRIEADVTLRASGMQIVGEEVETVTIPANDRVLVEWPVIVDEDATFVNVLFAVESEQYQDAARPPLGDPNNDQRLPVYRYAVPEQITTAGQLQEAETRIEGIVLPPTYDVDSAEVNVVVNGSLAAATLDSIRWLEDYPYASTEVIAGRLLANAASIQGFQQLAVDNLDLAENLDVNIQSSIQQLYARQTEEGGWRWSSASSSTPTLLTSTAALHALLEARDAGYKVDQSVLDRGFQYLEDEIAFVNNTDNMEFRSQQVYALYVLSKADRLNPDRIANLYESRQGLPIEATALLAQTIWNLNPDDARLADLQSDIIGNATLSGSGVNWENDSNRDFTWSTDTRTTAIVLDTFVLINPDSDLIPNVVRWLMAVRQGDHWETSQETVWGVTALSRYMLATGELDANYTWAFEFNGQPVYDGAATPETLTQPQISIVPFEDIVAGGVNRLTFERSAGVGNLYYTATLSAYLPVDEIEAETSGIIVSRQYFDEIGEAITQGAVGDIINVVISLTAPNDLNYVAIEDFYPAGAEAVNPNLLNESVLLETPSVQVQTGVDEFGDPIFGYGYGAGNFDADLRDERVILLSDFLPAGSYQYTYQLRLGSVGRFNVIPTIARELYFPDVFGRGEGLAFTILPE